ncbi:MAG: outer membrane beta-barrel family protein, partial [Bacteroidota bacterium]
ASKRNQNEPGINFYDYTTMEGANIYGYTKNDFNIDNNKTLEGGFDYRHSFPNSKRELSATGNISSNIRNENTDYQSSVFNSILGNNPYQHNYTTANFISSVVQADYSHPFNPKSKLETGMKGSYRLNDNDQKTDSYNALDLRYDNDTNFTNHYVFNEQIYAAYFLYSGTLKFFDYHVGLRGEQTFTTIDQKTKGSSYHNNYLSFFPNAAIKYSLGYQEDIQFSYSRRINRPNIRSLNPFKDISDSMNIRTGNPFLRPEYINSFELGYTKSTNKTSISATVYYKHSDDLISYYRIFNTVKGRSTNTFENYSSSENIGAEGSVRYDLGKAGNLLWSFNAYNNKVNANNLQTDLQSSSINWNTRLVANLKFAKYTAMQITANYSAPNTSPQSTVKGFSSVDAGVKQDFWKGKASLNVACGDVFNIREFDITSKTIVDGKTIYLYNGVRKRESRILTVSFSYRFGTTNNQTKKKRSDQQGGENMEEPMGY